MILFYNTALFFYVIGIKIASLFNPKAKLWLAGRQSIFEQLKIKVQGPVIWFHCASLGEFEMARPLIEYYRQHYPSKRILLSFFSPSGYEIRKNYAQVDYVFYLPIDTRKNAMRFIDIIQPELVIFAKYEVWHHYLQVMKEKKIPVFLISALFRKEQRYFKWYGNFFRKDLACFSCIFVQEKRSYELLNSIGILSVVSGDTRVDRVQQLAASAKSISEIEEFKLASPLLVLGSSWPVEEELLLRQLSSLPNDLKIVIAPHDISVSHIQDIENDFGEQTILFSRIKNRNNQHRIVIVDNIGLLNSIYQYADYALIGGGYTGNLHNVLEAVVYGTIVSFGPKHQRFPEAQQLLDRNAAFIADEDFAKRISLFVSDESAKERSKKAARQFIADYSGAVNKILEHIQNTINWK